MTKLAPSILSADFAEMGKSVECLERWGADYIHCDVMDGRFVPPITFGQAMLKSIKKHTALPLDVHLMVERPEDCALSFVEAGAGFVTFHIEAATHPHRLLSAIRESGCKSGIVLNPSTPAQNAEYLLELCDMVLIMSVNPGYGGQAFIPKTLEKARWLRDRRSELGLNFEIEIDGGINANTAGQAVQSGVDVLVAGSAVFGAKDPPAVMRELRGY